MHIKQIVYVANEVRVMFHYKKEKTAKPNNAESLIVYILKTSKSLWETIFIPAIPSTIMLLKPHKCWIKVQLMSVTEKS